MARPNKQQRHLKHARAQRFAEDQIQGKMDKVDEVGTHSGLEAMDDTMDALEPVGLKELENSMESEMFLVHSLHADDSSSEDEFIGSESDEEWEGVEELLRVPEKQDLPTIESPPTQPPPPRPLQLKAWNPKTDGKHIPGLRGRAGSGTSKRTIRRKQQNLRQGAENTNKSSFTATFTRSQLSTHAIAQEESIDSEESLLPVLQAPTANKTRIIDPNALNLRQHADKLGCLLDSKKQTKVLCLGNTRGLQENQDLRRYRAVLKLLNLRALNPNMSRTRASELIANTMGKRTRFARSLRKWELEWIDKGQISEGRQGKYIRLATWLQDEGVLQHVRQHLATMRDRITAARLASSVTDYLGTRATKQLEETLVQLQEEDLNTELAEKDGTGKDRPLRECDNPTMQQSPTYLRSGITKRSACQWLHKLGYSYKHVRKGIYIDGHEREDVVAYRRTFLQEIDRIMPFHVGLKPGIDLSADPDLSREQMREEIFEIPSVCSDNGHRPVMFVTHDESTFNANDGVHYAWSHPDHTVLYPKGRGKGIMVSDVVTPFGRLVIPSHITDAQILAAGIPLRPILGSPNEMEIRRDASEYLEYGKDNYWNGEKMFDHIIKIVAPIFKLVFPNFQPVFLFDNATNHSSFATDALNARVMNWGPGNDQPVMRDGHIYDKLRPQPMTTSDGIPKGIRQVLKERDLLRDDLKADCSSNSCQNCKAINNSRAKNRTLINRSTCQNCTINQYKKSGGLRKHAQRILCIECMAKNNATPLPPRNCSECQKLRHCRDDKTINGCCGRRILLLQPDFQSQKGKLQETLEKDYGSIVLFLPKFHCELNWIEYYWGWAKRRTRDACDYTLDGLRENIPIVLRSCPNATIFKFFQRILRMIDAYKEDFSYNSIEFKEKVYKYKAHRRVGVFKESK